MKLGLTLVLGGVFFAQTAISEPIGNLENGRKLARQCATCHGFDGYAKIPIAPHIGGEPASYIANQLRHFKDGSRTHEIMSVIAAGLDDRAILDLATWYSSFNAAATFPAQYNLDAAPEQCSGCHGDDGISVMEDAPNLAAETVMYIDTQLKAFRIGKRTHEIMSLIAEDLSDADIREAAKWYAGISLDISCNAELPQGTPKCE